MKTSSAVLADVVRFPAAGTMEHLAADLIETRAENFRLEAENGGLRVALAAYRKDENLAKDLAAKADAVREDCAQKAEARGQGELANELRGQVNDSQRSVTNGAR